MTPQKPRGVLIAAAAWCFIAAMTLYPAPDKAAEVERTGILCLVCGDLGVVDVVLNIILFVPLGWGLSVAGWSRRRSFLAILATTLTIETLQYFLIPGRDASLSDVLTNTLGGIIGFTLASRWQRWAFADGALSLRLAMGAAVAWVIVQMFTAWALAPMFPHSVYWGQWAPELGQFDQFTGSVVAVELNGIPLPGTRLGESGKIQRELSGPLSLLEVEARSGAPTDNIAPIFSIFDDSQREILLLGQKHRDLIFRVRTRADALKLRSPAVRLPNVLPDTTGAPLELEAEYAPGHYRIHSRVGGREREQRLALSSSWGWSFLLPFEHPFGAEMRWLTMLWIAGLLTPVGYWAARNRLVASSRSLMLGGTAVILLVGLAGAPLVFGLAPGPITEWIAGVIGLSLGWRLGSVSVKHHPTNPDDS